MVRIYNFNLFAHSLLQINTQTLYESIVLILCLWVGMLEIANWCSYFKQFINLVLEFWPQSSLYQSDCVILLHKISPEKLDLLTLLLAQKFTILLETSIIGSGYNLGFFAGFPWSQAFFNKVMEKTYLKLNYTLLKKSLWRRCFPLNFAKFLRTPFLYRKPPVAASIILIFIAINHSFTKQIHLLFYFFLNSP